MDNQLEEEINRYSREKNKHQIQRMGSLEAEVAFLLKRIESVEDDIREGREKPYHQDMLDEMRQELVEKRAELEMVSANIQAVSIPEEYIVSAKYDMQTMIGLLDEDVPNPQMLNHLAKKFISKMFIQRETKQLYMTMQLRKDEEVLFHKTIVAEI